MTDEHHPHLPYVPQILLAWAPGVQHVRVDGSLVFVDISGFTAMSERLARKGKVGAEEVVDVLNRTFTELLTIAAGYGGDLLKFGGDALLLLYTGEDHALRAVRGAAEMRTRLRTVGKVDTSAGKVALKMSVGVHTGDVDFFMVGGSHSELIVAGPAGSAVAAMEGAATAGEILMSHGTAAHLPPGLLGNERGPGILLRRTPPPPPEISRHAVAAENDPTAFVPVGLRRVLESSTADGEHRVITIGFVKFVGTDEVLGRDGPDALWSQLDQLVRVTQDAAAEFGVAFLATDLDANGGKIILTAGAPTTSGRDEEALLRTVRTIVDRYDGLALKVGVNRGPVFVADVGAPFRRAYTVIGDAVNLAARVMSRAEAGAALATPDVLDRSDAVFVLEELEPFMVKGKTDPVRAFAVGEMAGRRVAVGRTDLPLAGRVQELASMSAAIEDSMLRMVDVAGPAGIGKSRLVRAAQEQHADSVWLFSDCDQYEQTTPYFPFHRLMKEIFDFPEDATTEEAGKVLKRRIAKTAPDLLPWLPLIATVANATVAGTESVRRLGASFRQAKLHDTVFALFKAVLGDGTVLIVEDAHWIDDASRDLLSHLGSEGEAVPWTIVVARRSEGEDFDAHGAIRISLEPLSKDEASTLVRSALGERPMHRHQIDGLVKRAEGNPLFLIELVNASGTGGETHGSIEGLILARIDRLDPALRKLLRYAAAAGSTFNLAMLSAAISYAVPEVDDDDAWKRLGEFIVRRRSGKMRFRLTLFREVAYEGLPFRIRRLLHARLARAIEAEGDAEGHAAALSLHFTRADIFEEAWRYSVMAGDGAKAKYANVEAAELFERALAAARKSTGVDAADVIRVADALAEVCELAGLYDRADKALDRAMRLAPGTVARAGFFHKKARIRLRIGKFSSSLSWLTRAQRLLDTEGESSSWVRAEIAIGYASVKFRQGKHAECADWCRVAIPLARDTDHRAELAHAYFLLGHALEFTGDEPEEDFSELALGIYRELDDYVGQANVYNNRGVAAYYRGAWDEALEWYQKNRKARSQAGDVVGAATADNNIAEIFSDQGKYDEAAPLFRDVVDVFRAADFQFGAAAVMSNLARVESRNGEIEEATALFGEALDQLRALKASAFVAETELRFAECHLFAGRFGDALEATTRSLGALDDSRGNAVLRSGLLRIKGMALAGLRRWDEADTDLREAVDLARQADAAFELALSLDGLVYLGMVSNQDMAEEQTERDTIFGRLGIVRCPEVPIPVSG